MRKTQKPRNLSKPAHEGMDMLILFAEKHSVNNYIQVFRGNKLLLTSETENAYRDYIKHF